jgi:hypothetical protein
VSWADSLSRSVRTDDDNKSKKESPRDKKHEARLKLAELTNSLKMVSTATGPVLNQSQTVNKPTTKCLPSSRHQVPPHPTGYVIIPPKRVAVDVWRTSHQPHGGSDVIDRDSKINGNQSESHLIVQGETIEPRWTTRASDSIYYEYNLLSSNYCNLLTQADDYYHVIDNAEFAPGDKLLDTDNGNRSDANQVPVESNRSVADGGLDRTDTLPSIIHVSPLGLGRLNPLPPLHGPVPNSLDLLESYSTNRQPPAPLTGLEYQLAANLRSTLDELRRTRATTAVPQGLGRTVVRHYDLSPRLTYGEQRIQSGVRRSHCRQPKAADICTKTRAPKSKKMKRRDRKRDLFYLPKFFSFDEPAIVEPPAADNGVFQQQVIVEGTDGRSSANRQVNGAAGSWPEEEEVYDISLHSAADDDDDDDNDVVVVTKLIKRTIIDNNNNGNKCNDDTSALHLHSVTSANRFSDRRRPDEEQEENELEWNDVVMSRPPTGVDDDVADHVTARNDDDVVNITHTVMTSREDSFHSTLFITETETDAMLFSTVI